MIKRLRLLGKEFFLNPFFCIILICSILYLLAQHPSFSASILGEESQYGRALTITNGLAVFLSTCTYLYLAIFLLLSYEFLRRSKAFTLTETLKASPKALSKTYLSQLVILLSLAVVLSLYVFLLCLLALKGVDSVNIPRSFYHNLILSTTLYAFMPSLLGVLFGYAWQHIPSRIGFYFFFVITVFLASPMSETVYLLSGGIATDAGGYTLGATIQKIFDYWHSLFPIHNNYIDPTYGIGVEPYHWVLVLFWTVISFIPILLVRKRLMHRIAIIGCAVLAVLLGWLFWIRGSDPLTPLAVTAERFAASDVYYYQNKVTRNKSAQFSVISCDLELKCDIGMHAEAALTLDGTNLNKYEFTLYHGYKVTEILDEDGHPLSFEQTDDYITVENSSNTALRYLKFKYWGWHPELYSSLQGIYLPGYFCYYPIEGFYPVMDRYTLTHLGLDLKSRNFSVRVYGADNVFCNLQRQDVGSFAGEASYLTVVSGMYKEVIIESTKYILPWCIDAEDLSAVLETEIEELNAIWGFSYDAPVYSYVFYSPTILTPLPNGGTGYSISLNDTLLVGTTLNSADTNQILYAYCASQVSHSKSNDVKTWFLQILQRFIQGDSNGTAVFAQMFGGTIPQKFIELDSLSDEENHYREVGYYLYRAMEQRGARHVVEQMFRYLQSLEDADDLTFARQLAQEGEE